MSRRKQRMPSHLNQPRRYHTTPLTSQVPSAFIRHCNETPSQNECEESSASNEFVSRELYSLERAPKRPRLHELLPETSRKVDSSCIEDSDMEGLEQLPETNMHFLQDLDEEDDEGGENGTANGVTYFTKKDGTYFASDGSLNGPMVAVDSNNPVALILARWDEIGEGNEEENEENIDVGDKHTPAQLPSLRFCHSPECACVPSLESTLNDVVNVRFRHIWRPWTLRLFATKHMTKGDLVLRLPGELVSALEAKKRCEERRRKSAAPPAIFSFWFKYDNKTMFHLRLFDDPDAGKAGLIPARIFLDLGLNPMPFPEALQHSPVPNCAVAIWRRGEIPVPVIVAKRDIALDDQLSVTYEETLKVVL